MIKNIAWSGGGIKGIAYAGVIQVMEDEGYLDKIECVAGVSVGSITALLLGLRYSAKETKDIVFNLDFSKFKDGGWFLRLLNTYGIYKGDWALIWLESLVYNKTGIHNMTFGQLSPKYRDLTLIATNLSIQGIQVFNKDKTPDVRISEAARASMGIPLYWKRFKFSQGINPNHVFVDGGVLEVLPLSLWDVDDDNPETLGIGFFDAANPVKEYSVPDGNLVEYAMSVINTLTNSETAILQQSPDESDRLLWIDDLGYSSTDFNLTSDDKNRLFDSGVKYAKLFFEK